MPTQGSALNDDSNAKLTSGYYGNRGDGTSNWYNVSRVFDGGDVTVGTKTDAAATAFDTTSFSVVALLKAIGARLAKSATGLLKAEDEAHASGDYGVAPLGVHNASATASGTVDGDYATLSLDPLRRLRSLVARDTASGVQTSVTVNTALAASLVVKGSPGTLHSIVGYVASGENGWIQLHDATSAPSDSAVPKFAYYVGAASAHQAVNIPLTGHVCSTGITLGWSTTGPTKTAGASKMMVAAYYD